MATPTEYTYSISADFPNHAVSIDRLSLEIRASAISIAFDYAGTVGDVCSIWFKDVLPSGDVTTLDAVVAAHSGAALPPTALPVVASRADGTPLPTTSDGKPITSVWPTEGTKVAIVSPNWCDPTTWIVKSVRVVDEVATDSGDHATYTLANALTVDTYHGKLSNEDFQVDAAGHSYRVAVKVDSVTKTEQDPHVGSGGDFTVNYTAGTITFLTPLTGSEVVTVTYHYATTSEFTLKPDAGKTLNLRRAETQFSTDVALYDSVTFQPYGYVDAFAPQLMPGIPSGTLIPLGNPVVYKTMMDFINDANGAYPITPAVGGSGWRGLAHDLVIFGWDYAAMTPLYSAYGMEIRIKLAHDVPMGGTVATATFYCLSSS